MRIYYEGSVVLRKAIGIVTAVTLTLLASGCTLGQAALSFAAWNGYNARNDYYDYYDRGCNEWYDFADPGCW